MGICYSTGKTLKDVVEDGLQAALDNGCEGFDYTVAEIEGGKLKVVFEPDDSSFESVMIDGVNGFGYCLAFEAEDV